MKRGPAPQPVAIGSLFYVAANGATGQTKAVEAFAGDEVSWTSSNTSVATVDASGKVTGVSAGTVQITATSLVTSAITGQASVTVGP